MVETHKYVLADRLAAGITRKRLFGALLAGCMLSACGGGGEPATTSDVTVVPAGSPAVIVTPTPVPTPSPTPMATPTPTLSATPTFDLGVNVGLVSYWSGERTFSNLLTGSAWLNPVASGWPGVAAGVVNNAGDLISLTGSQEAVRILTPTAGVLSGTGDTIRCTWTGTGDVSIWGTKNGDVVGDHRWEFKWPAMKMSEQRVWLRVRNMSATDPIRNLDCREKDADPKALWSPDYLESLKPYGVLRFMDWSSVNGNPANPKWEERPVPGIDQSRGDGVALEYIVDLSKRLNVDPWVNVPWNASEDYIRNMAKLLHDSVPTNRHIYVELSNEVWNYSFGVTRQAEREGVERKLSDTPFGAVLRRYGERTGEVMKIWGQVFADRPGQLVRVAATQNDNPWTGYMVLSTPGLAENIEAFATAPYFGHSFFAGDVGAITDTAQLMSILAGHAKKVLAGPATEQAAIAKRYGKRFITYEAGQHVLETGGTARLAAMNRSNAMYDIYVDYITDWKKRFNDTMVLYASTAPISSYGAWGLREYAGQPLSETPKRRAAIVMGRQ